MNVMRLSHVTNVRLTKANLIYRIDRQLFMFSSSCTVIQVQFVTVGTDSFVSQTCLWPMKVVHQFDGLYIHHNVNVHV